MNEDQYDSITILLVLRQSKITGAGILHTNRQRSSSKGLSESRFVSRQLRVVL